MHRLNRLFFSLTGHGGVFLLRGVRGLPGAAAALQELFHLFDVFRRRPALKEEDGAVGQQPFRVGVLRRLGVQAVGIQPQRVPRLGALHDGGGGRLLPLAVLRQLPVQLLDVLRSRAGDVLERRHAEAVEPEDLLNRVLRPPVTDHQIVLLLLVRVDLIDLSRRVRGRQLRPDGAGIRTGGTDAQAEGRMGRSLLLQRHVQRGPGLQPRSAGQQAALLTLETAQLL